MPPSKKGKANLPVIRTGESFSADGRLKLEAQGTAKPQPEKLSDCSTSQAWLAGSPADPNQGISKD